MPIGFTPSPDAPASTLSPTGNGARFSCSPDHLGSATEVGRVRSREANAPPKTEFGQLPMDGKFWQNLLLQVLAGWAQADDKANSALSAVAVITHAISGAADGASTWRRPQVGAMAHPSQRNHGVASRLVPEGAAACCETERGYQANGRFWKPSP